MQDYWIERPYIDRNLFRYHIAIVNNFVEEYNNEDRPLREYIRPTHVNLFMQILHLAKSQMEADSHRLSDLPTCLRHHTAQPYTVWTNRKQLTERYRVNGTTVWRYIDRMIAAGMILGKTNHGSCRDFELLINPELLLIWDKKNPDFIPSSKFLTTENRGVRPAQNATFTPSTIDLQEHSNNRLISVNSGVLLSSNISQEQNENIFSRTRKDGRQVTPKQDLSVKSSEEQEQTPTPQPPAPDFSIVCTRTETGFMGKYKIECINAPQVVSRERFVYALSNWFVAYLLSGVFKGKNIYQGEINKTVEYVAQYWFSESECIDREHLIRRAQVLAWCADSANRYVNRSGFNFAHIYPRAFVDRGNMGCSLQTIFSKWFKKSHEYYTTKKNQQPILRDRKKMHEAMTKFLKEPNLDEYRRAETYMKKNIPHLLPEFYTHFTKPKAEVSYE